MLHGNGTDGLFHLGVDERDRRSRVLDDVADLVSVETEVHRHQDAAVDAHAEEAHQKAPGIGRDDSHPLALGHAEVVEGRREAPAHGREARVGDAPEPTAGRIRLVDDGHAAAVDQLGAL